MDKLDLLLDESEQAGIEVVDYNFDTERIKGLYCDNTIALSSSITSRTEKACVLAEELGHHYTSVGDIIDMYSVNSRKQEHRARLWAYNKRIGLIGIVKAYEHHCADLFEMAEYLEVTENFLRDALECYRGKYGSCANVDNYTISFEPNLCVMKRMD